jgi:hypothetical protein
MTESNHEFDDPALRSALKGVYGGQTAPESLRRLIIAQAQAAAARPQRGASWFVWRIAAVLLIVIGALAVVFYDRLNPAIATDTVAALVQDHDNSTAGKTSLEPVAWVNAGEVLAAKVQNPVWAARLHSDGWTFEGAKVCQINNKQVAHLFFSKGRQRLSVYSLPHSACPKSRKSGTCAIKVDDRHVLVGIVDPQGVFCLVGHCPKGGLKLAELQRLFDLHQAERVPCAGKNK